MMTHPAKQVEPLFTRPGGTPAGLDNLFLGKAAVLICNGPSAEQVDPYLLDKPGFVTMGINNGSHIIRPNLWCAQDSPTKFMASIWEDPKIMKFTRKSYNKAAYTPEDVQPTRWVRDCPNLFFHRINSHTEAHDWFDRTSISWGIPDGKGGHRVSTFMCAMCVLYRLGIREIAIIGADFRMTKEQPYFFEENKSDSGIASNNELYRLMNAFCAQLYPIMLSKGLQVVNCTPNSGLTAFPTMPFEEWVARHALSIEESTEGMYNRPMHKQPNEVKR